MRRVLVPIAIALPGGRRAGDAVHALGGETMGTRWSARFAAPATRDPAPLDRAIRAALDGIDREMSSWRPDSDLSRFGAAPAGTSVELPADFSTVLGAALALARESDGAFDPTIGPLVDLWGFGPAPRRNTPPDDSAIAAARSRVGWRRIAVANGRARQPGGIALDLSGIAKGFAVDRIAATLTGAGVADHLVEVGGELRGTGVKPDGTPWWVAVERLDAATQTETVVALHGLSIATSGDYRRFFEQGGRRFAHTIDPRTGWPVAHELAAVTVIHPSCMQADALATALTVLGPEAGVGFAARHGIAASFLRREGVRLVETTSPSFAAMAA